MSKMGYMDGGDNKKVVDALQKVMADTFVLYFKTHTFHWNVEGPNFKALHDLFDVQYNELWMVLDVIAERLRALDAYAPVSVKTLMGSASMQEVGQLPDAMEMLKQLANDNSQIVKDSLYPALTAAQEAGDEATADLMIQRIDVHEKAAWMLRSMAK